MITTLVTNSPVQESRSYIKESCIVKYGRGKYHNLTMYDFKEIEKYMKENSIPKSAHIKFTYTPMGYVSGFELSWRRESKKFTVTV